MSILLAWLVADLISGIVHWWEDRAIVGASRFAFINSIRADNERHHQKPGYFLRFSWWENINTTAPIAWSVAFVLALFGAQFAALVALYLGFGNLVHRWSHEPKNKLPRAIRFMQWAGLFISNQHHAEHHFTKGRPVSRENSTRRYCVMSNWLNPILDRVRFFDFLSWLFIRRGIF